MAMPPAVVIYSLEGIVDHVMEKKSLPYTKEQLDLEGEGIKTFFKDVWMKGIEPLGKNMTKNVLKDPIGAFQLASQVGSAVTSRNPQAIMKAGLQAGRFVRGK